MIDLCRFLVKAAQNERKSSNFATEKRLNRDGKAPTKNENGRNERFEAQRKFEMGKMNHFKPNEKWKWQK